MRKLLKEIGDRLQTFTAQRDNLALILSSPAGDATPLLKILEGVEEANTSDLFWQFTENFTDAESYESAVVKAFATTHEAVRLAMRKEQLAPWPAIPSEVLSEASPPAARLRALAAFSRELLPVPNGGNNIWIFYPLEIAEEDGYAALMHDIVQHEFPFPWCHHLRFIIRDNPPENMLRLRLANSARVEYYAPDLGMDAVTRSLEEEIADETLPLNERMAPLPIMAGNDFAHSRYPEALAKYELLLRYYAPLNNYPMSALALNGMGEVYEKMGDLTLANESYEAALVPASHGDPPSFPIWLNLAINLGNLCAGQARWEEAESYYDMAQQLATIARNAPAKISALESLGVCRQQQKRMEEAVESWDQGTVIAAQLQDVESCRRLLARLQQHYSENCQSAQANQVGEQLAALIA